MSAAPRAWIVTVGDESFIVTDTLDFVAVGGGGGPALAFVRAHADFFSDVGGDQVPDPVRWCALRLADVLGGTAKPAKLPPPLPRRRGKA